MRRPCVCGPQGSHGDAAGPARVLRPRPRGGDHDLVEAARAHLHVVVAAAGDHALGGGLVLAERPVAELPRPGSAPAQHEQLAVPARGAGEHVRDVAVREEARAVAAALARAGVELLALLVVEHDVDRRAAEVREQPPARRVAAGEALAVVRRVGQRRRALDQAVQLPRVGRLKLTACVEPGRPSGAARRLEGHLRQRHAALRVLAAVGHVHAVEEGAAARVARVERVGRRIRRTRPELDEGGVVGPARIRGELGVGERVDRPRRRVVEVPAHVARVRVRPLQPDARAGHARVGAAPVDGVRVHGEHVRRARVEPGERELAGGVEALSRRAGRQRQHQDADHHRYDPCAHTDALPSR